MNDWLERQLDGAPAALVERTRYFRSQVGGPPTPEGLAAAARLALLTAISRDRDRAGALDLLAADALVTLALAAHVEVDPASLSEFAASLLASGAGTA